MTAAKVFKIALIVWLATLVVGGVASPPGIGVLSALALGVLLVAGAVWCVRQLKVRR